jgi:hypothetical protein
MIRTVLTIVLLAGIGVTASLRAEPSPSPSNRKVQKQTSRSLKTNSPNTPKVVPAPATKEGWSLINGSWVHSDGYKLVKGQVVRIGTQTHKKPPKPPTKTEMEAATKSSRSPSPADAAAQKAAERERNLAPRPAPQTGTHL